MSKLKLSTRHWSVVACAIVFGATLAGCGSSGGGGGGVVGGGGGGGGNPPTSQSVSSLVMSLVAGGGLDTAEPQNISGVTIDTSETDEPTDVQ
jgi:hypothetical protein